MRLLHTADWHLGKTLEGRSRLPEQEQFLDELQEIVEQEKIDVILMAGDIYDTVNPPASAEQLFYESISRLADKGRRQVIIIAGNHDHPERLAASQPLSKEQGITLLGLPVSAGLSFYLPSCQQKLNVAALPYPSEARLHELLVDSPHEELLREQYDQRIKQLFAQLSKRFTPDAVNIAMSHLFVAGGEGSDSERPIQVGGAYTVSPSSLPGSAAYVALGHLHRPQQIQKAKSLARYAGSPLAYSFSEVGYTKSVTLIDIEPGQEAQTREIFLSSGKPLVRWQARAGLPEVYQWLEEGRDKQAWIDLEIHVQHALSHEEIQGLRQAHSGFVHIRPLYPEMDSNAEANQQIHLSLEELFQQFYLRQTNGAQPEPELTQLFLELIADDETLKREESPEQLKEREDVSI